jgi:hypothetical protein
VGFSASWAGIGFVESAMALDLAASIRDKIRSGALPLPPEPPAKYFAGKGTGQLCGVCEQAITAEYLEFEVDVGGRTLRFHEKCLDMWRQARG